MMKSQLEIEVISIEKIIPSCPTPHHLRHYNFSFQDQINPPVFMPMVLFYPNPNPNTIFMDHHEDYERQTKCNHLKIALSQALTQFYVLAGRVVDNSHVNCEDQGVPYVEARANCQMSNVIQNPVPSEMNMFVPRALDDVQDLPMVIQITHFDCGGLAVSVAVSHKVGDALSFFMFLNAWAATARGETTGPPPRFESATLFPPKNIDSFKPNIGMVKENISTKRFVFTAPNIASLRDKYEFPAGRPTRIEALSAFIWTRFISATKSKIFESKNKIHTIFHAVNLRPRVDPPLPENYFGNISRPAITIPTNDNNDDDVARCRGIIETMRSAIRKVGDIGDGEKHLSWMKEKGRSFVKGELVTFNFTSLCRFPVYEADFGWGKAEWAGSASLTFKNLVVFMDTKNGGGIEAWINLKEEDMEKMEADKEFLSYVNSS
ncbi:stemmadenine O-acetyltransferase [Impatiens glandulifera]|uniref:stemmadenine O-acetyltransferase n=1 Tax=Impatiens glandulifera TaxID=253017 RepID=UPI001FB18E63|nr:stemmadenine O-acetyltransferase [Impatiens glandulifera]